MKSRANYVRDAHSRSPVQYLVQTLQYLGVPRRVVCFRLLSGIPQTDRIHIHPGRRSGKGDFIPKAGLLSQNGQHFAVENPGELAQGVRLQVNSNIAYKHSQPP